MNAHGRDLLSTGIRPDSHRSTSQRRRTAPGTITCRTPAAHRSLRYSLKLPSKGLAAHPAAVGCDRLHLFDEARSVDIRLDAIADPARRSLEVGLSDQPVDRRGN